MPGSDQARPVFSWDIVPIMPFSNSGKVGIDITGQVLNGRPHINDFGVRYYITHAAIIRQPVN